LPSGEDDVRGPRVRQVWRQGATAFGGVALDRPASPGPMLRYRRQGPTMQVHITSINTSVHKEGFKIDFILSSQSKLLTGCSESGYSTSHESDAGSVPRRDSARRVFMLPDRLFSLRRIFCSDSSAQPVHFHRNVQRVRRKGPDSDGGRPPKTALESGGKDQRKRRVSALSLTGACRFTYL
jgi:hypothetical protein